MCGGGQHFLAFFADICHTAHEWCHVFLATFRKNEPLPHIFRQAGGRERSKLLTILDLLVYAVAHIRSTRVGNNGTCAECTGTVFKTSLHPTSYISIQKAFH